MAPARVGTAHATPVFCCSLPTIRPDPVAPAFFLSARRTALYYLRGLYGELTRKDIFLFAQAIAFKVLVTVVPVLILVTGIMGQVLRRDRAFEFVTRQIRNVLPPYQTEQTLNFLLDLQKASGAITAIGLVGLFVSAITLMTTLRAAISNIFNEDYHKARSILGGYVFDLRMVGQVGLLFLLSVGVTVGVQWMNKLGGEFFRWYGFDYDWLFQGWSTLFQFLGLVLPLFISISMFSQLFYFVPRPRPPRRSVFRGAVTTALLWEAAKYGFTFYAANIAGFDLGNTFGLILAFVFWVYYSGIVLCIGALVVLVDEKRQRQRATRISRPVPAHLHRKRRRPRRVTARPAAVPAEAEDG